MSPETFLEKFDLIADAPGAVVKMRRLILDLAVQGKLVAQKLEDEPASELLERIHAEKQRLIKSGEIKKQDHLPPVSADTIPYSLPLGWAASQLGDIAVCLDYLREPINGTERDLRIAGKKQDVLFPYYGATQQQGWIDDFIFDAELVLLGEDGVPFFDNLRPKAYMISGKTWVNNHAHVFRGVLVSNKFLMHCLNTFDYTGRVAGSTRSKLNKSKALDIPIPLPPLAEQKRIVAKVDELMALCDRLEQQQTERETQHTALSRASLTRFSEAPTPENLNYLFHPTYTTTPADLRKTILTLAVQGKLVPFSTDEGEQTVGDHIEFQNGYAFKSEWFKPSGIRLCRNANVSHGFLDWHDCAFVDDKIAKEFERFALSEGDIVLSLDRPLITTGLKVARVRKADLPCLLLQRVAKPVPKHDQLDLSFFMLWLNSSEFIDSIDPGRSNGVPHISTRQVQRLPFILPPLAEQKRIVAKVDELMKLVDQLEEQLTTARTTAENLLNALLADLTSQKAA